MALSSANPLEAAFFPEPEEPSTVVPVELTETTRSSAPVGSSVWWLDRLLRAMRIRNERLATLRSYYRGTNETWQFANTAHRETFGTRFKDLRANLAQPVVEVPEQRMRVIGLELWDDTTGSDEAWRIWKENQMDHYSSEAHLDALSTGLCPIIVGTNDDDVTTPVVTVEDPLQVYVEVSPVNQRVTIAGIKSWLDDEMARIAVLYFPDRIEWWRTEQRERQGEPTRWLPMPEMTRLNSMGVVPIAMLRNAPRVRAEHEGITAQLDLYAKTLYDMATTSDYQAFPQRYATGVSLEEEDRETDADGNPIGSEPATFQTGPNRIVATESPDAAFGQFQPSDLLSFIRELEALRHDIAIITHTPHRLLVPPPTAVPPSGESVRLSDFGLTAKVRRKLISVGNGWEQVVRLAFRAQGDFVRAARMDLEVVWADPELHTESEHVDALTKMQTLGVPQTEIWRRLGASPQQIRRWEELASQAPAETPPSPEGEGETQEEV